MGGIVHTHSPYATAWAIRGEPIPCVLTAMADEFGGEIPVGPFALIGDEEIGRGVVETLESHRSSAVLMRGHGVFALGSGPREAVKSAVMCEDGGAHRALARALGPVEPLDPDEHRRALPPLPERLWPALSPEGAGAPRIGLLAIMQALYDEMLPGITERQAAYAEEVAAALAEVADVDVGAPVKDREDIERACASSSAGRRRAAGGDAHLRPGDARRPRAGETRLPVCLANIQPVPRSRPSGTWAT